MHRGTAHCGETSITVATLGKMGKVLIVDDDQILGNLLGDIIELNGFEAVIARSAPDAMDCLNREEGCFELIITDYDMPKMNGIEFTRIVRKRFPQFFIVGMSGHEGIRDDFIEAGANTFLQKPFRSELILNLLSTLTGHCPM